MIEPSSNVKVYNHQVKKSEPNDKLKTSVYVINGLMTGAVLGEISNNLIPVDQDTFTKTESDLLKITDPKDIPKWKTLVGQVAKNKRAAHFNIIGAVIGGTGSLAYCLIKKSENKKEK